MEDICVHFAVSLLFVVSVHTLYKCFTYFQLTWLAYYVNTWGAWADNVHRLCLLSNISSFRQIFANFVSIFTGVMSQTNLIAPHLPRSYWKPPNLSPQWTS